MVFTQGKKDSVEILTTIDLIGNVKWQQVIGRALQTGEWQHSRSTPTYYKIRSMRYLRWRDVPVSMH
jgi:hypothetical protein